MHIFDYSFLENGLLPAGFVNITNAIIELKVRGAERKSDFRQLFTSLEGIAKVQSVKGSNAIQGIVTSEKRLTEIVNNNSAPLNQNEAAIAGYRDALNLIHTGHDLLDVCAADVLLLHRTMLSYTPVTGSSYKTTDNTKNNTEDKAAYNIEDNIEYRVSREINSLENSKGGFTSLPTNQTPEAMKQLFLAYREARSNYAINQLLLIPCFILDFLCLQPFSDGNGRMSRLLSLLLLYNNGFDVGKYISLEAQINNSQNMYYEALRASSEQWPTNENTYFPFIENFLTTLLMCYRTLDKRLAIGRGTKVSKHERIAATVLNSSLPISKKEICYLLPDVSKTTIEAVLAQLLKNGFIEKLGASVNTKYIKRQ